jgi:hypothetical protein
VTLYLQNKFGIHDQRVRFAWRPVPVCRHVPGGNILEDAPVRWIWLDTVVETKTFWCGWVAFERDNSLPAAGKG